MIIPYVHAFIAYDCSVKNMSVLRFSTIDDYLCPESKDPIRSKNVKIQLIQRADNGLVHVYQCKVKITRIVNYCGMSSHNSIVSNGLASYIKELGRNNCLELHSKLMYQYGTHTIVDMLKSNASIIVPVQFSGTTDNNGKCTGSDYSDYYGSWNNVIVQGTIEVGLSDYTTTYSLTNNLIHLRSGLKCKYSTGSCIDSELGETYWQSLPSDMCHASSYDVLYQGPAKEIDETSYNHTDGIIKTYLVETEKYVFGLSVTKYLSNCGQIIWQTQHPKLLIIIDNGQGFIYDKKELIVPNMDLFTYMNSKFLYLEQHFRKQITLMYKDLIQQRCKIEKQVIKTLQSTARTNPNEFALIYMNSPGYTAQTIGSLITLIKCQPVDVQLIQLSTCYNELPVKYLNNSYYMNPNNLILQKYGTEISCSDVIYGGYKLGENWFTMNPKRFKIESPLQLSLNIKNTWEYTYPQHLAESGIYSQAELDQLKQHLMFPLERPAIENAMSKKIMGVKLSDNNIDLSVFVDKHYIQSTVSDFLSKSWSVFTNFGMITSGFLGIYMIIHIVRYVLTTSINGYTLYKTLGCGFHLFASLFTCLTTAVMYLSKKRPTVTNPDTSTPDIENQLLETSNVVNQVTTTQPTLTLSPTPNPRIYPQIPLEYQ